MDHVVCRACLIVQDEVQLQLPELREGHLYMAVDSSVRLNHICAAAVPFSQARYVKF